MRSRKDDDDEELLKGRVRSQVACVRTLIDELDRQRATTDLDDQDDDGIQKGLTTQLFEEIERLEALLMEVENQIVNARRQQTALSSPLHRPLLAGVQRQLTATS
jgi:hypothetical protein